MDDNRIDLKNRFWLALLGLLCLCVGGMFFVPGLYFLKWSFEYMVANNKLPDIVHLFLTSFTLSIGAILLLLSLKFFRGKVDNQSISFPVLFIVSLFFIAIATTFVVLGLFHVMPSDSMLIKAIVSGYTLGGIGLWGAIKQKKKRNTLINPDTSTDTSILTEKDQHGESWF